MIDKILCILYFLFVALPVWIFTPHDKHMDLDFSIPEDEEMARIIEEHNRTVLEKNKAESRV